VGQGQVDYCIIGVAAFELLGADGLDGDEHQYVDGMYGALQKFAPITSIPEDFAGPPCNPNMDSSCQSFSSYLGLIR
jgi:hypothetical protein